VSHLARLELTCHMFGMTTALADPPAKTPAKPNPLRRAHGARPIALAHYEAWYAQAIASAGLTVFDIAVLAIMHAHFKRLAETGEAPALSYEAMARELGIDDSDYIKLAVFHLRALGFVGIVKRGAGRSHAFLPCLPRKQAATLQVATSQSKL
jgi:hypothetical protein